MKRLLLIIVAIFAVFSTTNMYGQSQLMVKGGYLGSNVTVEGFSDAFTPDRAFISGWNVGVFTELPMGNGFSFIPGIEFAEKGFMAKEGFQINIFEAPIDLNLMAETRLRYLQAPLWLKYTFGEGPAKGYITGGPTIGYAVDGLVKTKASFILDFNIMQTDLDLSQDLYNRFEIGAGIGAGVSYPVGPGNLFAEANYQRAFTDILADPVVDVKIKNQGFGLNIGYKFPLH